MNPPDGVNYQLKADSELFMEVLEYLLRMPAVPTTVAIARKVKERVEDPARRAVERKATETARMAGLRHGANYSPAGRPVIEASVDGDQLRLWTPSEQPLKTYTGKHEWKQIVVGRLQKIETIKLTPGPAIHFE